MVTPCSAAGPRLEAAGWAGGWACGEGLAELATSSLLMRGGMLRGILPDRRPDSRASFALQESDA
eukprot:1156100-Pelagomonas_calceolata.AAC.8